MESKAYIPLGFRYHRWWAIDRMKGVLVKPARAPSRQSEFGEERCRIICSLRNKEFMCKPLLREIIENGKVSLGGDSGNRRQENQVLL